MWKTLHAVSFTYPSDADRETQERYRTFFKSLGHVIPCPSCAKHFRDYEAAHPVTVDGNRESLARWVVDLHNDVNRRSGKPQYTFEEVEAVYGRWDGATRQRIRGLSESERNEVLATPRTLRPTMSPTGSPLESPRTLGPTMTPTGSPTPLVFPPTGDAAVTLGPTGSPTALSVIPQSGLSPGVIVVIVAVVVALLVAGGKLLRSRSKPVSLTT